MRPLLGWFDAPLVGRVELPAYFTLLAIGFAMATWITVRESRRIKLDPGLIFDANLWMVVWGIIGARVLHLIADGHFHEYVDLCLDPKRVPAIEPPVSACSIVNGVDPCATTTGGLMPDFVVNWFHDGTVLGCKLRTPDFLCDEARHVCYPQGDCFAALEVWRGGLAYYGGFIFATLFAMYFLRRHKLPIGRVSDLAAPAIMLGLFFGRMGCFLNGCCYGKQTASAIGVHFPRWSFAWHAQVEAHEIAANAPVSLGVHPTQLYEAIACLAISCFLYFVWRPRKRHDGDLIAGMMLLYGIARSVIEVFRDDDRGVFIGAISTSQILSIPLAGAAIAIFWYVRRPSVAEAPAS